ncbi:MAG: 4Fe-4S binding protein [Armatimonadetes bacterium]|nr:4Fe-4S binding protein [Armatimonadota bacterium]
MTSKIIWEKSAEDLINKAPFFIRGLVKKKILERAEKENLRLITPDFINQVKRAFGNEKEEILKEQKEKFDFQTKIKEEDYNFTQEQFEIIEKLSNQNIGYFEKTYEINLCAGARGCPLSLIDVQKIGDDLKEKIENSKWQDNLLERRKNKPILRHHKFKIAVSGCPNACSEPQIKDFGVIGNLKPLRTPEICIQCGNCLKACRESSIILKEDGPEFDYQKCLNCGLCIASCPSGTIIGNEPFYKILAGGKLGRHPRLAEEVASLKNQEEIKKTLEEVINFFIENLHISSRLGEIMEKKNFYITDL